MADTETSETYLIVGAGFAGAKAAEGLRSEGFEGRIVLVGDEPELPYERPPLSKDYLRGESPREDTHVHPDGFYEEHRIELRTSEEVTGIDTDARQVELAGGEAGEPRAPGRGGGGAGGRAGDGHVSWPAP